MTARVVHVLASAAAEWGGPPVAVRDLAEALSKQGVVSTIVAPSSPSTAPLRFHKDVRVRICGTSVVPKLGLTPSARFLRVLDQEIRRADIAHLHELWHFPQFAASISAKVAGQPYVASLHGALDTWAARQRRGPKWVAWHAYQRRILNGSAGVHALSLQEERDVRQRGIVAPTKVIPNGVNVQLIQERIRQSRPEAGGREETRRHILFLGRLDPKKGLDILLRGFALIAEEYPDVDLWIAGPDPLGLWGPLGRFVKDRRLSDRVLYHGLVSNEAKYALLNAAHLFVLPSLSEGMSVSVLEALASGIPVIVSRACNLPEAEEYGAGVVTESTEENLTRAIRRILDIDDAKSSMGARALRLAQERFSADKTAREMRELYEDLLSARRRGAVA